MEDITLWARLGPGSHADQVEFKNRIKCARLAGYSGTDSAETLSLVIAKPAYPGHEDGAERPHRIDYKLTLFWALGGVPYGGS